MQNLKFKSKYLIGKSYIHNTFVENCALNIDIHDGMDMRLTYHQQLHFGTHLWLCGQLAFVPAPVLRLNVFD